MGSIQTLAEAQILRVKSDTRTSRERESTLEVDYSLREPGFGPGSLSSSPPSPHSHLTAFRSEEH